VGLGDVYEELARESGKLITFDRIAVAIFSEDRTQLALRHVAGVPVAEWVPGLVAASERSLEGMVRMSDEGVALGIADLLARDPDGLMETGSAAGLSHFMGLPLRSSEGVFGVLSFAALASPNAGPYLQADIDMGQRIADQIAGTLRLAELVHQADDRTAEVRLVEELGRITSSVPGIDDLFAHLAPVVKEAIPYERLSVSVLERGDSVFRNVFIDGEIRVPALTAGTVTPVLASGVDDLIQGRRASVTNSQRLISLTKHVEAEADCFAAGLRSKLAVSLVANGRLVAVIHFRSADPDFYTQRHVRLAEAMANQISGAVLNGILFGRLENQATEAETMAAIGRVMTSSNNLDGLFEVVLKQVKSLIPADRMALNTLNFETGTTVKVLAAGLDVNEFPPGVTSPLPASGSYIRKLLDGTRARSGAALEEFAHGYPEVEAVWKAGIRSLLHVPLVFDDDLIGVLAIGSTSENAYGDREIEIAESVSRQIAGAIANLQLSQQREFALSALGESESLFRALLQYAPNGLVVTDATGRIVLVNEQTDSLFGYSAGELEGQKVDILVPSRLRGGHPAHREGYMHQPTSRTMGSALDLVALRNDGTEIPVDISLGPLETSEGTLIISSIRDMTETREAETALRTSEAELSDLFENAPLGYHEVDSEGRVTRVNTTLLEMLGLAREEMVGQSVFEFVMDESRAKAVEALESALNARPGELATTNRTMVRKDGTHLPITADYRQIRDETGKVTGLRVSSRDVTDVKRLENQLMHAQKMEAVGQLAGGVAHDFNNILTAVMAHASLAKRGLSPADCEIVEDIEGILKAADRAADLTRQLLTFSRQDVARPKPISLDQLLPEMDRMVRRLIGEHIELVYLLNTSNARVMIDPGQVEQVITNLVLNARDAMPGGGTITMETSFMTLPGMTGTVLAGNVNTGNSRGLEPGRYMCVLVTDTGEGMDEETLLRIFDPFFTTKEPGKGTGLGLATCYGVIAEAGGEIRVESEPGRGTRFDVVLPLAKSLQDDEQPNVLGPGSVGRETIMFVEDEASVRESTARALRVHGYTVVEATNGAEVVGLVERGEFGDVELLLTDMVMPLMGGVELADRLRSMDIDVRTLFISGYKGGETASQRELRPDESYLPKPYLFEKLLTEIRSLLDAR
jgi:PAS domain S-box-containing protein